MDKPVMINQAAKILSVPPSRLRQVLRSQKVIDRNNLPRHELVQRGLFHVENRQFVKGKTGIRGNYAVALVTGSGLTYISALMKEMENPEVSDDERTVQ